MPIESAEHLVKANGLLREIGLVLDLESGELFYLSFINSSFYSSDYLRRVRMSYASAMTCVELKKEYGLFSEDAETRKRGKNAMIKSMKNGTIEPLMKGYYKKFANEFDAHFSRDKEVFKN